MQQGDRSECYNHNTSDSLTSYGAIWLVRMLQFNAGKELLRIYTLKLAWLIFTPSKYHRYASHNIMGWMHTTATGMLCNNQIISSLPCRVCTQYTGAIGGYTECISPYISTLVGEHYLIHGSTVQWWWVGNHLHLYVIIKLLSRIPNNCMAAVPHDQPIAINKCNYLLGQANMSIGHC